MNTLSLTQVTMTSLELVDFINSQRKSGEAELRHSDFLDKTVKVLGLEMSESFRSSYMDSMNRQKPCYCFPKREACLMAMSYSYDLQAKVFDRMTALEQQQKTQSTLMDSARNTFDNALHFAKLFNLEGNQALLAADKATARHTGFSPMKFLQIELVKEEQQLNLTATEIGKELTPPLSAIKANLLLQKLGFQEKLGAAWSPTTKGKSFAVFLDTGKKHSDGTPITQLKWLSSIIKHLP